MTGLAGEGWPGLLPPAHFRVAGAPPLDTVAEGQENARNLP